MSDIVIPKNYKSQLNLYETQVAIKTVKDFFQGLLAERLHLLRVSAPLFVDPTSGLNDNLNGVERPVNFHIAAQGDREAEIVQSLAKWKRYALQKYGDSIYTYYNDGYRSLAGFAESYPHFCSAENNYALYFNQNDFSWAGSVFVMFLTPVAITSKMKLILSYMVGASQDAEFYLVKKTDKTGSELAQYIYEEIKAENALQLSFQWLYSNDFISVMQSLESIPKGEYYLAFSGTSDNSHPMVKSIKFMKE